MGWLQAQGWARARRAGLQMLRQVQLALLLPPGAVLAGCFLHFRGFRHRSPCLCPFLELQQQQLEPKSLQPPQDVSGHEICLTSLHPPELGMQPKGILQAPSIDMEE